MKTNLELKLQRNLELLESLELKKENLESNIANLKHKIENQKLTLQTLK